MAMEINYLNPKSSDAFFPERRLNFEFPIKVYAILELADRNISEIAQSVSWLSHGRAFSIHNKVKFMEEVVPLFFDLTKIRSFIRQLNLWGFRRLVALRLYLFLTCFVFDHLLSYCKCRLNYHSIERGSDEVWYHNNFLRGKPECMKYIIRTKIKGDNSVISQEVRVPNFDALPPLPICNKLSADVRELMENAILKLKLPSCNQSAPCAHELNVPSMQSSLPLINAETEPPRLASSRHSVNLTPQSSLPRTYAYAPLSPCSRRVSNSNESPHLRNQEMPQQYHNTKSISRQSSIQESSQMRMEPESLFVWNVHNLCAGQSQSVNFDDLFEPLPISFMNNDESFDELASFLEDTFNDFDE